MVETEEIVEHNLPYYLQYFASDGNSLSTSYCVRPSACPLASSIAPLTHFSHFILLILLIFFSPPTHFAPNCPLCLSALLHWLTHNLAGYLELGLCPVLLDFSVPDKYRVIHKKLSHKTEGKMQEKLKIILQVDENLTLI